MRKRPLRVVVYFSPKEYSEYLKQINSSGLTKQAHGLKTLLGKEIKPRLCDHHPQLLQSLSGISNDTHHILRTLQESGQLPADEISRLGKSLEACWQHIREF